MGEGVEKAELLVTHVHTCTCTCIDTYCNTVNESH